MWDKVVKAGNSLVRSGSWLTADRQADCFLKDQRNSGDWRRVRKGWSREL